MEETERMSSLAGAMEALRLALETEHEFQGETLTINMLEAALAYFESESKQQ